MAEGFIQKGDLQKIIADVVASRRTGDLRCYRPSEEKHLYFKEGELVFASTSVDAERLGQLLLSSKALDPVMLDAALSTVGPGRRLGRILVVEGVLTPEQLIRTVKAFIRKTVISIFSWKDGRVAFTDDELTEIEDVCVEADTADILLDGCRHIALPSVVSGLVGNIHEPVRVTIDPSMRFQKIRLSPEEGAIVQAITNFTTADEICQASPLERDETLRFLCGLITAGVLEAPGPATASAGAAAGAGQPEEFSLPDDLFGDSLLGDEEIAAAPVARAAKPKAAAPKPASRPAARPSAPAPAQPQPRRSTPPPPAEPAPFVPGWDAGEEEAFESAGVGADDDSGPTASDAAEPAAAAQRNPEIEANERGMILEVHRRLALMDYYTLLEVDRRSSDTEIKKSYFALAKKYHPDRSAAPHLNDLKKELDEIFAQVNKAYEVVKDAEKRREYDQRGSRPADDEIKEGVSKDTDEQIADRNFRMAKTLYDQRKFPEAVQLLKAATRLNPSKGNYFFLLANALTKHGNRREAEETYLKAIELDKFNSDIFVSLGLLYRASNMGKRAEAMFVKALQLNDNHPVALRELASLRPAEEKGLKGLFKKAADRLGQGK